MPSPFARLATNQQAAAAHSNLAKSNQSAKQNVKIEVEVELLARNLFDLDDSSFYYFFFSLYFVKEKNVRLETQPTELSFFFLLFYCKVGEKKREILRQQK